MFMEAAGIEPAQDFNRSSSRYGTTVNGRSCSTSKGAAGDLGRDASVPRSVR
jgi:hypothetical protein